MSHELENSDDLSRVWTRCRIHDLRRRMWLLAPPPSNFRPHVRDQLLGELLAVVAYALSFDGTPEMSRTFTASTSNVSENECGLDLVHDRVLAIDSQIIWCAARVREESRKLGKRTGPWRAELRVSIYVNWCGRVHLT
eukprot:3734040-Pleurochrysis_carterae.AAC.1